MRIAPDDFVLFPELRDLGITYSRTHINRLIAAGVFPAPKQLNPLVGKHGSTKAWRLADIKAWLRARFEQGDEPEAA